MNRLYHAFLLRIWKAGPQETPGWRASLEDPHTRQVISFTGLDALNEYLLKLKFLSGPSDILQEPHLPNQKKE